MIDETIARIKDGAATLRLVEGAAAFAAAAAANPTALPAAYVMLLDERADPSQLYGRMRQRVHARLGVTLVWRHAGDARGAAALADLQALRAAVQGLLVGWAPTAAHEPYQFESGSLAAIRDGHIWWQDAYRTSQSLTVN